MNKKRKSAYLLFMLIPFFCMTGCVTVRDILGIIPFLFLSVFLSVLCALRSRHPVIVYFSILAGIIFLFALFMITESFSSVIGTAASNQVLYFFLQVIPCLVYAGITAFMITMISKKISTLRINHLSAAILSTAAVFAAYMAVLFSGGCIDCELSEIFMNVFGWPVYIM